MLPKLFGSFGYFFLFFAIFIPLFFKRLFEYKNTSRTNFLSCSTAPKMIQYVLPEYSISSEMYKRRPSTPMPGRFLFNYVISNLLSLQFLQSNIFRQNKHPILKSRTSLDTMAFFALYTVYLNSPLRMQRKMQNY